MESSYVYCIAVVFIINFYYVNLVVPICFENFSFCFYFWLLQILAMQVGAVVFAMFCCCCYFICRRLTCCVHCCYVWYYMAEVCAILTSHAHKGTYTQACIQTFATTHHLLYTQPSHFIFTLHAHNKKCENNVRAYHLQMLSI